MGFPLQCEKSTIKLEKATRSRRGQSELNKWENGWKGYRDVKGLERTTEKDLQSLQGVEETQPHKLEKG
jgi:hypothetical protein